MIKLANIGLHAHVIIYKLTGKITNAIKFSYKAENDKGKNHEKFTVLFSMSCCITKTPWGFHKQLNDQAH